MPARDQSTEFPQRLKASTERRDIVYERDQHGFGFRGTISASLRRQVELELEEGRLAVCRGTPDRATKEAGTVTPVYRRPDTGSPAVPTGRVLVRFAEAVGAESRRADLERAGYAVVQVLPYAPHAAWVESVSGGIAASLAGIDRLEALPEVVNVEPQLITERAQR